MVLTLQQIVLSKNAGDPRLDMDEVLTLQQIVLSKNSAYGFYCGYYVLTLQQIVLSKNTKKRKKKERESFDFTTNCSF